MDVPALLHDARRRHGLSQRALACRCRTSQTHISRIERGDISPSVETLAKLLEAMGERLELQPAPGPRGNQTTAELRADYEQLPPGERVAQAAELSYALTSLAGAEPGE